MDDDVILPENPQTLAELLQYLPLPASYCVRFALVFSAALAERLAEVQGEAGAQFIAEPRLMTDGRYMLGGDLLSAVGEGQLYSAAFSMLDSDRFTEIAVIPFEEAVALLPQTEEEEV